MRILRLALSVAVVFFLMGGYFASQWAYFIQQDPVTYAAKVDQPSIRVLSAVLLLSAIALSFMRGKESST